MQARRSITASLLLGYAFLNHAFTFSSHSALEFTRSLALYARYDMRITRMACPNSGTSRS